MNFYKLSWQLTENCAAVWKTHLGKNKTVGAVILDLSKALDYILHDLIAKLDACGFDKEALSLTYSYLKDRKQSVHTNIFEVKSSDRPVRSQQNLSLKVLRANQVKFGEKSYRVLGPKIWNRLALHIKNAEKLYVHCNFISWL